jgi:glycosyltransferase involved in cell wall biosynthesis
MTDASAPSALLVSVICPLHNEAGIIREVVPELLKQLDTLDGPWELLLVNDGSTDGSDELLLGLAAQHPQIRPLGNFPHRGRGHALRIGIAAARGEIVVTTELDLSWGRTVVHDLVRALRKAPGAQIAIASPHLPGGGYKNVPAIRVWLSRIGNRVIRDCLPGAVTMNTGMTRAYRREAVQSLPLQEDDKVFHLEVIQQAAERGQKIIEIPAVLEWRQHKEGGEHARRRSSSHIPEQIAAHAAYLLRANPRWFLWRMGAAALLTALVFWVMARWLF